MAYEYLTNLEWSLQTRPRQHPGSALAQNNKYRYDKGLTN